MSNKWRNKWYVKLIDGNPNFWEYLTLTCCRSYCGYPAEKLFDNPQVITDTTEQVIAVRGENSNYIITQIYDNYQIYLIDSDNNKIAWRAKK